MRLPSFLLKRGGVFTRLPWLSSLLFAGLLVASPSLQAQNVLTVPTGDAPGTRAIPLPSAVDSAEYPGSPAPKGPLQRLFGGGPLLQVQEQIPSPQGNKGEPELLPSPESTEADDGSCPPATASDSFPIQAAYKYNSGGGYLSVFSPASDFTLNLQNQVTLDGTFHDRSVNTTEQGFNVPFYRTYLYGNITKNIDYQVSVQGFLGQFNVLDAWGNFRYDDRLNFRVGRQLTPLLYEYYGWSPAWEPVITNSLLFQVAGKRQEGAMFWGRLLENKIQYQAGVFNGIPGAFVSLDHNVDFAGTITFTPFKGGPEILDSLCGGIGVETGYHNYALNDPRIGSANGAGEPTTNSSFITSTGIPFFSYTPNSRAAGNSNKGAPHLFWYGRFSLVGEYFVMNRQLSDALTGKAGDSVVTGYYVNASYFLTGERYKGDGLGGYNTVTPLNPFMPRKGIWGPGAWEVAAQISQLSIGQNDFNNGFVNAGSTNRCDQLMVGLNWWPNKYVRWSFDWVLQEFNNPIQVGPPSTVTFPAGGTITTNTGPLVNSLNVYWVRCAMFF